MQVTIMVMRGKYFPMRMGAPAGWNFLQLKPA